MLFRSLYRVIRRCGRRHSVGADGDAGGNVCAVAASSGAAPFFQLVFNDVGKRSDQELEKWCVTPCAMQWPAPAKLTVVHSAIGSKEVL